MQILHHETYDLFDHTHENSCIYASFQEISTYIHIHTYIHMERE